MGVAGVGVCVVSAVSVCWCAQGASLSSIMFGMTGLQLGQMDSDPTGWGGTRLCPSLPRFLAFLSSVRPGSERCERRWRRGRRACRCVPLGWESITFEAWLGGQRYRVVGEHGAYHCMPMSMCPRGKQALREARSFACVTPKRNKLPTYY